MIDNFIEELRHPEKAFVGTHRIEGHTLIFNIKFTPEQLAEIKEITGEQNNE